jgi:uncharacterized membrane protein (DUF4010 family)
MEAIELFQRLAVALAVGLVIGIERGWKQREEPEGERAAGLRTHTLAGLLGGVWGAIALSLGDSGGLALGLAFAVFSGAMAVFRLREMQHDNSFGATTLVASMMAFALGAYAVLGDKVLAAAAAVATAMLLALKAALHAWLRRLTWEELRSGLVLLAMTVILLPILPNREIDPLRALNPFEIWLMTVMLAVVSFAGYAAVRLFGAERGVLVTGLAGGLVSSTAVTLTLARLAKEQPAQAGLLAPAILLSNAVMMGRVLVVATVFNAALFEPLAPPLALAASTLGLISFAEVRRQGRDGDVGRSLELKNPFELVEVLKFGALLAAVMVLGKITSAWAGPQGLLVLAAASGLADVDAITLLMARLARTELGVGLAALAILLAVAVNTLTKIGLAWIPGGPALGRRLLAAVATSIAAAAIGFWLATR